MAKPNYNFQKRQKELTKQKKREKKRLKKLDQRTEGTQTEQPPFAAPQDTSSDDGS